jgi:hypothetical protein
MPLAGLDTLDITIEQCPDCGRVMSTRRPPGWGLQVLGETRCYRCWLRQRDDAPSWT